MDIQQTIKDILAAVEACGSESEAMEAVKKVLWSSLRVFFNTTFIMRRFQKSFFKNKDKNSLIKSKELEKQLDTLLDYLKDQKENPKLLM